jgi:transcription elongation factor GreA
MKKQFHLTREGIKELQDEHDELVARRSGIADDIKTAREQGDLSENAEYHVAKAEHEKTESRIAELEHILQNVEIISKPRGAGQVQLGSSVKLKGAGGKSKEFKIVGTVEADPLIGKISDESPIGKALLGKKVGDEVAIVNGGDSVANYKVVVIN